MKHKFKAGDKVTITMSGQGCATESINTTVTIKSLEKAYMAGVPGYSLTTYSSLWNNTIIGEGSFTLVAPTSIVDQLKSNMERTFKVGDRVVIKFDGHSSPGTIIQLNSYDESFVETAFGTTWYDNSRLTLRGPQKRSSITKKDILDLISNTLFRGQDDSMTLDAQVNLIYTQWKTTL
jgi:hypothetical protein